MKIALVWAGLSHVKTIPPTEQPADRISQIASTTCSHIKHGMIAMQLLSTLAYM